MNKLTQPSGAGFVAVDMLLADLVNRKGLRQAWESIDGDIQAEIKHEWALKVTEVLDMQAAVIRHYAAEATPATVAPPEAERHLTPEEQGGMHRALRRGLKFVQPDNDYAGEACIAPIAPLGEETASLPAPAPLLPRLVEVREALGGYVLMGSGKCTIGKPHAQQGQAALATINAIIKGLGGQQ